MKLPSLDDLDLNSDLKEFENEPSTKKAINRNKRGSPSKSSLPQVDSQKKSQNVKDNKKEVKKERPKIPKSQYDSEGKPILAIPDLDDVDLSKEINRFFG